MTRPCSLLSILIWCLAVTASTATAQFPPLIGPGPQPAKQRWTGRDDTAVLRAAFSVKSGGETRLVRNVNDGVWFLTDTLVLRANGVTVHTGGTIQIAWRGPADRPAIILDGVQGTKFGTDGDLVIHCEPEFPLHTGVVIRNDPKRAAATALPSTANHLRGVHVRAVRKGGLIHSAFAIDSNGLDANNDMHTFEDCGADGQGAAFAGLYMGPRNTQAHRLVFTRFAAGGFRFGAFVETGFVHFHEPNFGQNQTDFWWGRDTHGSTVRNLNSEGSVRLVRGRLMPNHGPVVQFAGVNRWASDVAADDPVIWGFGKGALQLDNILFEHTPKRPIIRSMRPGVVELRGVTAERAELTPGELPPQDKDLDEVIY